MNSFLLHSLILSLSFLVAFLWQNSNLASYTTPALGVLASLYLLSTIGRRMFRHKNKIITTLLLNTSTLLLIQTTGNISSPLFFLLYFLCFYVGFSLMPEIVFTFSLAVMLFFLPEISNDAGLLSITKLASFLLLAPLAYFFGKTITLREKEIKQTEKLKRDIQNTSESIIKDVSDIVKMNGTKLGDENIEKLKDIVDQSKKIEKEAE